MDFLKSAVASAIAKGPLASYSIGERVTLEDSIWTLNSATKREDGSRCSIFTFDIPAQRKQLPIARNAFRKFRILRHPGLVKVLDTIETDASLNIVTERVTPLSWYTRRKALTEEAIKWGLWSIAKTVKFINEEAASVHACLRLPAVFTSESGEWKLGGFEILSSIQEDDAVLYTYAGLVPGANRCISPEVSKSGWGTYKTNAWTAADAWGFANLMSDVFDGPPTGPAQPTELKDFPKSMQVAYKRLLSQNPKARPSVANFLEQGEKYGGFFQTPLIHVANSLESLGLKSEEERGDFLKELNETAEEFPDEFLKHKVLPELLRSAEFGGGGSKVLTVVLKIGAKISEEEYASQVTPVIIRLFASPDRALRVCLLDSLPLMIDHLPQKIVNEKIFPNVVSGFTDVVPVVREQTVKAVLVLIGKLADRTINGELLKHLAKTANDTEPGIRTNTTICLGKIARNLGPNTRTKVLVAAFTRSLRDPFVHARNAGLMALNATSDLFSEDDCANKILPAICPSLLDKEKIVRDQANKALDQFTSKVRKHALTLPESTQPTATTHPAANGAPRAGTPSNATSAQNVADSSWTGWAISSFTNKLAAADGNIQPNAKLTVAGPAATRPANGAPTSRPSSTTPSQPPAATSNHTVSRQPTEASKLAHAFVEPEAAAEAGDDLWDDMGDNPDDLFADAGAWGEEANDDDNDNDGFFSAQPSTRSSVSTNPAKMTTTSGPTFDDKGEPDFAGWLKAQQAGKSKKGPLPKGLAPVTKTTVASKPTPRPVGGPAAKNTTAIPVKTTVGSATTAKPQQEEDDQDDNDDWGDAWT